MDKGIQYKRSDMIWTSDSKTEFLVTWTVLPIESPAIVIVNIAVELGIANGMEVRIIIIIIALIILARMHCWKRVLSILVSFFYACVLVLFCFAFTFILLIYLMRLISS